MAAEMPWSTGETGAPILDRRAGLRGLAPSMRSTMPRDHTIVVGSVQGFEILPARTHDLCLYFRGGYGAS